MPDLMSAAAMGRLAASGGLTLLWALVAVAVGGRSDILSDLRLSGNYSRCEGRLELLINGSWNTVCSRSWSRSQAEVACRQLSCGTAWGLLYKPLEPTALDPSVNIFSHQLSCQGYESHLNECLTSEKGVHNCTHLEDVILACGDSSPVTNLPTTSTPTTAPEPTGPPRFRLVDGGHTCSGTVELYLQGHWDSVLLAGFPRASAQLVCRSLGCGTLLAGPQRDPQLLPRPQFPVRWNLTSCQSPEGVSDITACATWSRMSGRVDAAWLLCSGFQPKVRPRLANGMNRCEGNVEVYYSRRWRPLCSERGRSQEWASEVCRHLQCGNVSVSLHPEQPSSGRTKGIEGVSCSASRLEECHEFSEETESNCYPSQIMCQQASEPSSHGLGIGDVLSVVLGLVLLAVLVAICGPMAYRNLKKVRRKKERQWIGPTAMSQNVSFHRDHATLRPRSEDLHSGHDYSVTPKRLSYLSAYPALDRSLQRSSDLPDNSSGSEYDFSGARKI